jgi:hypothetical protein
VPSSLPDYTSPSLPEYTPSGRPRRRVGVLVAIAAGVLVLPLAGFVAVNALAGDGGGADSPEAAVQAMFDAVGDEDVLGVMDTLLPGEQRSLQQPLEDIVAELRRLEILSEEADLGAVPGVDLEFRDLTFETEEVADGVAVVELTGGTVEGAANLAELPIGDLLLDLGFDGEQPTGEEGATESIEEGLRLATVEEDGRWYVSLWFSIAEAARASAGAPPPDPAAAIEATGSESPEQVVDDLLAAAGRLDLTAMLAMLPPGEARALHEYAPLFVGDAQAELDSARDESGFSLTVEDATYDVERDGDRATVVPKTMSVQIGADGEQVSVAFDGECARFEVEGEQQEFCRGDAEGELEELGVLSLAGLGDARVGIEVVEEDGRWYLSPTATALRPLVAVLESLTADDIRELIETAESGFPFGLEEESVSP